MTNRDFDDRDIERLLAGKPTENLADTTEAIDQLRALDVAPTQGEAQRAGATLASVAAAASAEAPAAAPVRRSKVRVRTAIAGGAALLLAGMVGGTAAADSAAPGDALYGLDRAIERLGLGAGGAQERIAEAREAEEAGDTETAIALVDEAVSEVLGEDADAAEEETETTEESTEETADESTGDDEAETTESSTDESTEDTDGTDEGLGSEVSEKVHECLRDIFEWMETTDATGREFGQGVAERHRNLHVAWQADSERWQSRHEHKTEKSKKDKADDEVIVEDEALEDEAQAGTGSETSEPETTTKPRLTSPQRDADEDAADDRSNNGKGRDQGDRTGSKWDGRDADGDRDGDRSSNGSSGWSAARGIGFGAR
ncbi:hypothetical protein [Demequina rhizosphaerae]|uniref:hypothetical protein n=1 Tax=Demequina rhizosphaerae TaxID=1638985 RepID=UPI000780876D|nr:hypothetical protein [Demequina rhizosphaerae]